MLCYSTWEEWELIQATSRKEKLVLSLSEATTESGTAETGSSVPAGWCFNFSFPVCSSHPFFLTADPLHHLQARSQRRQRVSVLLMSRWLSPSSLVPSPSHHPIGPVRGHFHIPEQRLRYGQGSQTALSNARTDMARKVWEQSLQLSFQYCTFGKNWVSLKHQVSCANDHRLYLIHNSPGPTVNIKNNLYCISPQNAFPLSSNNKWLCSHGNSYFGRKKIRENWISTTGL